MKRLKSHSLLLFTTLMKLVLSPHFVVLSLIGNAIVFIFASIFYMIENGSNPLVDEKMDAVWWAFTTVTTVGFCDIVPMTFLGRVLGIFLMLIGTGIFGCYIAIISEAFLAMELQSAFKKRSN